MATITIRNLDESLKQQLRIEAAKNGHSMEEEMRRILKRSLAHRRIRKGVGSAIHQLFAKAGNSEIPIPERSTHRDLPDFGEDS
ncbi:MAG: hypothetical protein MAG581_01850 [Deltaproteobacteria bacterium]|nr:hypothetical protein [Deltaproteobacteria bacterium]